MEIRLAAHVHSNWSYDGHWRLSTIVSYFRRFGYHGVLTSEHDVSFTADRWQSYRRACAENSADDFLIVPGIEYSDRRNIVHVLVWGDIPFLGPARETGELLEQVQKFKGVAVLAHPSRRDAWQEYRSQWTSLLLGVEQWNRKVDGVAPGREAMVLFQQNSGLLPFVGLDFHRANQFFPLYMAQSLAGRLSEDSVLAELRAKRTRAKISGIPIQYFLRGRLYESASKTEHLRRCLRGIIKRQKNLNGCS